MPKTLKLTIPWSALCSDNRKFVTLGVLSPQYREAKAAMALLTKAQARKAKWEPPQGALKMVVCITEPDHKKRDHLNFSKCLCDGITAGEGVWFDDSQVRDARWYFSPTVDKDAAGATILIEEL